MSISPTAANNYSTDMPILKPFAVLRFGLLSAHKLYENEHFVAYLNV